MFIGWMVHVHSIKFPFHLVSVAPPPILGIYCNIYLWYLDMLVFNIFKFLSIILVGVPSLSVSEGMDSVTSLSLDCYKDSFFSH